MKAEKFLAITSYVENSGGFMDIIINRFQPYVLTGAAVTAANAVLTAMTNERNNVHTLLADGIVEVAPTIAAATANDGVKLRYITKELMECYEGNVKFGSGLNVDDTIDWLGIAGPNNGPQGNDATLELTRDFVSGITPLIATNVQRTTASNLRAATIAANRALWDAVDTL
jgi:hypothetical protein